MTDISLDPRFQPTLEALRSLHGDYTEKSLPLQKGQVAEFLTMLNTAKAAGGKMTPEQRMLEVLADSFVKVFLTLSMITLDKDTKELMITSAHLVREEVKLFREGLGEKP